MALREHDTKIDTIDGNGMASLVAAAHEIWNWDIFSHIIKLG